MTKNGWSGEEGGGGAVVWRRRRRRPEAAAAGELHNVDSGTRQGEAAASAAGTAAAVAAAEVAVGLPPCSSLSSHLRGDSLLFFK